MRLPDWYGYTEYDALMRGEKAQIERVVLEREFRDPAKPYSYYKIYTEENEGIIRDIIRYALEKYAGMTPEEAYERLTLKDITSLKLRRLIRYGLRIPYEASIIYKEERTYGGIRRRVDDGLDPQYIVSFAYPEIYPYDMKEEVLKSYKMVLSGEMERYPRGYFIRDYHQIYALRYGYTKDNASVWEGSSNEYDRAVICLRYVWELNGLLTQDTESIVSFMEHRTGSSLLKKYQLRQASKLFTDKLEYTNTALDYMPGQCTTKTE